MPSGKLGHVAVKVLLRHLMVDAMVSPFEHRPERLNAISMSHPIDILFGRMLDVLMVVAMEVTVGERVIRVDIDAGDGAISDKGVVRSGGL